ncbi:transmembrane protein, putative [Bodo saltans]|uniref:Transmembrane protein, putative n=1 Tax=Bodo saltans TaxID=75058 RepID=A0A0S4IVM8_BODSA|nr:transmembrane protein, putative [Bodo saltans]|eukprot:CUG20282.1 transmembrane protein, putative [Bodo saltans]
MFLLLFVPSKRRETKRLLARLVSSMSAEGPGNTLGHIHSDAVEMDEVMRAEMQGGNAAAMRRDDAHQQQHQRGEGGGGVPPKRSFSTVGAAGGQEVESRVGKLRRMTQIPISFVLERLQLKLDSANLMVDMLIYIPFLIMFVFFIRGGRDTEPNFFVMQGIRNQMEVTEFPKNHDKLAIFRNEISQNHRLWVELDKNYWGIGNQGDWGPWLSDVFVRTTFECDTRNPDATLPDGSLRAARGQTFLIGAARARTIRTRIDSCGLDPYLMPENKSNFPSTCYAIGHDSNTEDTGPFCTMQVDANGDPLFKYFPPSEVPGVPTIGWEGVYHNVFFS